MAISDRTLGWVFARLRTSKVWHVVPVVDGKIMRGTLCGMSFVARDDDPDNWRFRAIVPYDHVAGSGWPLDWLDADWLWNERELAFEVLRTGVADMRLCGHCCRALEKVRAGVDFILEDLRRR